MIQFRNKTRRELPGKAVVYLLIGIAGGLGLDITAKALLETYPLDQFVLLRSAIGTLLLLVLLPRFGGVSSLRTRHPWWHVLRTLLACGAMFGFFYGLSQMPLVSALAVGFTAPLMMTALSALLLGDAVGWRRWLAVAAGFAGVVILLRPGADGPLFAYLAVLFAAFCYACTAITARILDASETTLSLSLYVMAGPLLVSTALTLGNDWLAPDPAGWALFGLAGLFSLIAWLGLVSGYRRASPAALAPLEYLSLVGGALAGYLLWSEVPDGWTIIGSLIIVGSGVFVAWREVRRPDLPVRRRRVQARQSVRG